MSPRKKKSDIEQPEPQAESQAEPATKPKRGRKKVAPEPVLEVVEGRAEDGGCADADSPDETDVSTASAGRIVVFTLAGQLYAFPIECVQEIQQIVAFTDCPDPVPALVGMVNLRGIVVPLVDLRLLLAMEPEPYTLETPMIICHVHGQTVAVAVDEVEDVLDLPADCLQAPPRLHALGQKMLGVCRMEPDLVFLLDPGAVLPSSATVAAGGRA